MATRTIKLMDTIAAPSALTLEMHLKSIGITGTPAFSGASTVTDEIHAWSLTGLAAGEYLAVLKSGSVRVGQAASYVHRDATETVWLDQRGLVEDTILQNLDGSISSISGGSGAYTIDDMMLTLADGVTVVSGCDVIITTTNNSPSLNVHDAVTTRANGSVPAFKVDAGVYYIWREKTGVSFSDPLTLTVSSGGSYTVT